MSWLRGKLQAKERSQPPVTSQRGCFAELIDSSTFCDGLVLFPGGPLSDLI